MNRQVRVRILSPKILDLTVRDKSAEITSHHLEDVDLFLACRGGGSVATLISGLRRGHGLVADLLVGVDGTDLCPHTPFDLDPLSFQGEPDTTVPPLLVQHVKRNSLIGTIRYVELFEDGLLVERRLGLELGADVIIENTFSAMAAAHASVGSAISFGGAKVRARYEAPLLHLAHIYSQPALREQLRSRAVTNTILAELVELAGPEFWDALSAAEVPG